MTLKSWQVEDARSWVELYPAVFAKCECEWFGCCQDNHWSCSFWRLQITGLIPFWMNIKIQWTVRWRSHHTCSLLRISWGCSMLKGAYSYPFGWSTVDCIRILFSFFVKENNNMGLIESFLLFRSFLNRQYRGGKITILFLVPFTVVR